VRLNLASGCSAAEGSECPLPPIADICGSGLISTHWERQGTGFGSNPGHLDARIYVLKNVPSALVVVLHGCTQSASVYDNGSGWSKLAERHGFAVLFPQQRRANNPNLKILRDLLINVTLMRFTRSRWSSSASALSAPAADLSNFPLVQEHTACQAGFAPTDFGSGVPQCSCTISAFNIPFGLLSLTPLLPHLCLNNSAGPTES
jgi:hypothetical protein